MASKKQTNDGYTPLKKGYQPTPPPPLEPGGMAQDGYTPTKNVQNPAPPPKKR